jgi:hypothetical protein
MRRFAALAARQMAVQQESHKTNFDHGLSPRKESAFAVAEYYTPASPICKAHVSFMAAPLAAWGF